MSEDNKVLPIRADIAYEAKDIKLVNSLLFARILEVVDDSYFNDMTLAAVVGVVEMVKHHILARQD